jgi:hypothetical protein
METSRERRTNSAQQSPTQGARLEEGKGTCKGCPGVSRAVAERRAAELVLERITVNYIRHNLTEYETHLKKVAGQAGRVVRRRVYDEIAAQYPEYAEECKRQMRDRSGEAQDATG